MRKKILSVGALVVLLALLLCACDSTENKYPRVDIYPTHWNADATHLPLRENHHFAEVPYSIEETDVGYDIIIHAVEDRNGAIN